MRLGFIGTGKIASSVITGICTSRISFQQILVSSRNKNIAQKLKKRFDRYINIIVCLRTGGTFLLLLKQYNSSYQKFVQAILI